MFRMTIRRKRNTGGTPLWYAGLDHFFDLVKVEHSILVRGPGGFNAGKDKRTHTSSKPIDFSRFGIPLPSKRTLRCNKPGFTTPSGIIRNLLMSILRIADSQNACCCVNSSSIKAIAISLMRDGLGLKPSLEFHERKKVLVGSKKR